MIWRDNIEDLQYYHAIPGVPCYCEHVLYPDDMRLQASVNTSSGSLSALFTVYSPDGLTYYEDATPYFQWYMGVMNNSTQRFINARLKSYSPAMCNHVCFIVRLQVTWGGIIVFDKYTDRYCVPQCCDFARDISIGEDGIGGSADEIGPIEAPNINPISTAQSDCGLPLIQLKSVFDCYDYFSNEFYGIPSEVITGTADFRLTKISTFQGRIVPRPREITREVSYNCVLQRAESARQYLFEGFEYFPAWKMLEIENQLHAQHIYINNYSDVNKEFHFDSGKPFKKVDGADSCTELFKLEANLSDCIIRQTFGACSDDCASVSSYFIIPSGYETSANGLFYDENGVLIANTYSGLIVSPYTTGLLEWLRGQDGVSNVEDVDISGLDCEMYALVKVEGTGLLPTSIYYTQPIQRNRLYALPLSSITDICGYTGNNPCSIPDNGTVVISEFVCGTPDNGTVIISEITPDELSIIDYGAWVQDSGNTDASLYANQVTINIKTVNTTVIGEAAQVYTFSNEIIATISAQGNPNTMQILNSSNTASLGANQTIIINTNGTVVFSGDVGLTDINEATLDFTNLVYNIN